MGAINHDPGHVEISPPLDQAEHDHLRAASRGEVRLVGPDDLEPWCPREPCPHGCCLRWGGRDSDGTGADGLQLLIDRFLSADDPDHPVDDSELSGFTFHHDTNGAIAREDDDRGLSCCGWTTAGVRTEMPLRGDPSPWELGPDATGELPWLSDELRPSEQYRLENEATLAKLTSSLSVQGG